MALQRGDAHRVGDPGLLPLLDDVAETDGNSGSHARWLHIEVRHRADLESGGLKRRQVHVRRHLVGGEKRLVAEQVLVQPRPALRRHVGKGPRAGPLGHGRVVPHTHRLEL